MTAEEIRKKIRLLEKPLLSEEQRHHPFFGMMGDGVPRDCIAMYEIALQIAELNEHLKLAFPAPDIETMRMQTGEPRGNPLAGSRR